MAPGQDGGEVAARRACDGLCRRPTSPARRSPPLLPPPRALTQIVSGPPTMNSAPRERAQQGRGSPAPLGVMRRRAAPSTATRRAVTAAAAPGGVDLHTGAGRPPRTRGGAGPVQTRKQQTQPAGSARRLSQAFEVRL